MPRCSGTSIPRTTGSMRRSGPHVAMNCSGRATGTSTSRSRRGETPRPRPIGSACPTVSSNFGNKRRPGSGPWPEWAAYDHGPDVERQHPVRGGRLRGRCRSGSVSRLTRHREQGRYRVSTENRAVSDMKERRRGQSRPGVQRCVEGCRRMMPGTKAMLIISFISAEFRKLSGRHLWSADLNCEMYIHENIH